MHRWDDRRFHSGDELRLLRGVLVDVLDQFRLRIRRPGYKYGARVCDGVRDGLKIVVILGRVPAPDGIGLVVDMSGRMVRVNDESFGVREVEMEYARLAVINPDDGMKMMAAHEFLSNEAADGPTSQPRYPSGSTMRCDPSSRPYAQA
jgi:hypothetical protein